MIFEPKLGDAAVAVVFTAVLPTGPAEIITKELATGHRALVKKSFMLFSCLSETAGDRWLCMQHRWSSRQLSRLALEMN
jgi:hypothetical protein